MLTPKPLINDQAGNLLNEASRLTATTEWRPQKTFTGTKKK